MKIVYFVYEAADRAGAVENYAPHAWFRINRQFNSRQAARQWAIRHCSGKYFTRGFAICQT